MTKIQQPRRPGFRRVIARTLVLTLSIILLLLASGAVWLVGFFQLDRYRETVAELAGSALGVNVEIAGELELNALVPLRLEAGDVTLRGDSGVVGTFNRIDMAVNPLDLLRGTLRLDELQLHAKRLDLRRREDGTWNIAPALTRGQSSGGGAFRIRDAYLDRLELRADEVEIHAPEDSLNLAARSASIQVDGLPLMRNGVPVVANPAILSNHEFRLRASAGALSINDSNITKLNVDVHNDHGRVTFSQTALQISRRTNGLTAALRGGGTLEVRYDDDSAWSKPTDLSLGNLDLRIDQLSLGDGGKRGSLTNTRVRSGGMPLPHELSPEPGSLKRWLAKNLTANRIELAAEGDAANLGGYALEGFSAALEPGDDQTRLHLSGDRVAHEAPDRAWHATKFRLETRIKATAAEGDQGTPALSRLLLASGELDTGTGGFSVDKDTSYRFQSLRLSTRQLPLLANGQPPGGSIPMLLAWVGKDARLNGQVDGLSFGGDGIDKLALHLAGTGDAVRIQRIEARKDDARIEGSGELRPTNADATWQLRLTGENLTLGMLSTILGSGLPAHGRVKLDASLRGSSLTPKKALQGLNGRARAQGRDLKLEGIDLDAVIDRLLESQSVGLFDVGAYALLGPFGPLLTTGASYAQLATSLHAEGNTHIAHSIVAARFTDGVAHLDDTAFATDRHRVALKGTLELTGDRRLDLRTAVINRKGCARYVEDIGGTLDKPVVSDSGLLVSGVIKPIKSVIDNLAGLFGRSCDHPFYQGEIEPPEKEQQ